MLPVEETGSLAIKVYLVKVRGFKVEGLVSCCDRRYAPIPAAATITPASRPQRRYFEGDAGAAEENAEAWRDQDGFPLVAKGGRSGCKPWSGIRGFICRSQRTMGSQSVVNL